MQDNCTTGPRRENNNWIKTNSSRYSQTKAENDIINIKAITQVRPLKN